MYIVLRQQVLCNTYFDLIKTTEKFLGISFFYLIVLLFLNVFSCKCVPKLPRFLHIHAHLAIVLGIIKDYFFSYFLTECICNVIYVSRFVGMIYFTNMIRTLWPCSCYWELFFLFFNIRA